MNKQLTFDDDPEDDVQHGTPGVYQCLHRPPSFSSDSCPWCLAPADTFVIRGPTGAGCTHCGAAIPLDAEWYRRGEKIVFESQ